MLDGSVEFSRAVSTGAVCFDVPGLSRPQFARCIPAPVYLASRIVRCVDSVHLVTVAGRAGLAAPFANATQPSKKRVHRYGASGGFFGWNGMSTVAQRRGGTVLIGVLVVSLLITVGVVPTASANHGPAETDFTLEPMDPPDRRPGADDARVGTIGVSTDNVTTGFETLLEMRAVYSEGSWADCGPGSSEVFGIDRGGDNDRYEVDESLTENVKRFSAGEDTFVTEFYDEDDFGSSTHLNAEDRTISIIECVDNPDQAGWYQIDEASVTGRTADGEVLTYSDPSHYFWICECANEREARAQLGPPPSEPQQTPTPTTEPTRTRTATGHETDSGNGTTVTDTDTDDVDAEGSPTTPTAIDRTASTATASPESRPTPTTGDWDAYRLNTPTRRDGAGFAPGAAVIALLVAAHWFRTR